MGSSHTPSQSKGSARRSAESRAEGVGAKEGCGPARLLQMAAGRRGRADCLRRSRPDQAALPWHRVRADCIGPGGRLRVRAAKRALLPPEEHADGMAWARFALVLGLIAATWLLVCVRGKLPSAPTTMQPLAMTLMAWLAVDIFFCARGHRHGCRRRVPPICQLGHRQCHPDRHRLRALHALADIAWHRVLLRCQPAGRFKDERLAADRGGNPGDRSSRPTRVPCPRFADRLHETQRLAFSPMGCCGQ